MRINHNVDETCKILNISKPMLYKLWRLKQGPRITKIGRRTFVSSYALEAFLKEMELS
jgi:predicted DNA-binding transcriptional regulator AlpA